MRSTGSLASNPPTIQSQDQTSLVENIPSKAGLINSLPIISDLPPLSTVESTGHIQRIRRPDPTQIFLKSDIRWPSNFVAPILVFFVMILVTSIYGYSWNASNPTQRLRSLMWNNPTNTLLTINIMDQVISAFLGAVFTIAYESLRWKLCRSVMGVKFLDFMALSGSITTIGLTRIPFSSIPSQSKILWIRSLKRTYTSRLWSATRSFLCFNLPSLMK